jgi:hypothetical protein
VVEVHGLHRDLVAARGDPEELTFVSAAHGDRAATVSPSVTISSRSTGGPGIRCASSR